MALLSPSSNAPGHLEKFEKKGVNLFYRKYRVPGEIGAKEKS